MTELVALTGLIIVGVVAIVGMAIGKGIELEFFGFRFKGSKTPGELGEAEPGVTKIKKGEAREMA